MRGRFCEQSSDAGLSLASHEDDVGATQGKDSFDKMHGREDDKTRQLPQSSLNYVPKEALFVSTGNEKGSGEMVEVMVR